jgi:2-haloacid dehalogenase
LLTAKIAGLPWDCILSAENVKRYKPDPEVYLLVPQLFDLKPNQLMMVAAHEHDLQAAHKYELNFIPDKLIARPDIKSAENLKARKSRSAASAHHPK